MRAAPKRFSVGIAEFGFDIFTVRLDCPAANPKLLPNLTDASFRSEQ